MARHAGTPAGLVRHEPRVGVATDANVGAKLESIYVAMNMHWEDLDFEPPAPPTGMEWHVVANTAMPSPDDI